MLIAAESGFAASLYELCRRVVHEFVVLSRHCLEGGQTALEALLQDRLVSMTDHSLTEHGCYRQY